MSIIKESMKRQKNILTIEIRKELNLLPTIIKEKKLERETMHREILKIKEKINVIKKELNNVSVNIINFEKEYTSIIVKNDKVKKNQKIILNIINNEIVNNNNLLQNNNKEEIKELFSVFFNFENECWEELSNLLLNNSIEFTKLLIGAYAYLKMLHNDIPQRYIQLQNKLSDLIYKAKKRNNEKIYELIFSYMENILIILDNKEKSDIYKQKYETLIKNKNEIFIKLKLIEEQKNEKEDKLNSISTFIKDLLFLIEKNKLLLNFPKHNNEKNDNNNKIIDITACNLNISCPKNTINNEFGKNNERVSVINIDLTSTSLLDNKFINKTSKKERESFEIKPKNMNKRMTLPKYNNIYELEKDINEQYIKIKNNPFFKTKRKVIKKKVNTNSKQSLKLSSNKSKEKKVEKISKNNTTMTYNSNTNSIINNINNLINQQEMNKSYDSTFNKRESEKLNGKIITYIKPENAKKIHIKYLSNSSDKKVKEIKEEKKNNIETENKRNSNQSLKDNNIIKGSKYINIKHNNTNLMKKKNSLNRIKINQTSKPLNIKISNNNNTVRKNSPENKNPSFLMNMMHNNVNKNKETLKQAIEIKHKNINSNDNSCINNNKYVVNNNKSKNCHIIPFKKYRINYIRDQNNEYKNKKGIRINTNNYYSDRTKGNYIQKNFANNSQIIKSSPKEEITNNKKPSIKI